MSLQPTSFVALAWTTAVRVRAFKVALVVGTILVVINHIDAILSGAFTAKNTTQMVVTYLVPYAVSTYSSVKALRDRLI